MDMHFPIILQIIGVALGLIVALATVVAFFRANLAKTQIESLRGDRDDLQKRVDRLETENDDLVEGNQVRDATINEQISKIHTLEKIVTGREQLNHLQKQLDAHDKRVDERHSRLVDMMNSVVDASRSLMISNQALVESNQTLVESNQYVQAALIDFLKKHEYTPSTGEIK